MFRIVPLRRDASVRHLWQSDGGASGQTGLMNTMKRKKIRIIQVSDCHVPADPNALYRGQSADENLSGIVRAIRKWKPGLVMLTGDVSEDGSRESYERTSRLLAQTGADLIVLPGNHDDVNLMRQYFPAGPWDGPYVHRMGDWQILMLDSTVPGQVSGSFTTDELKLLQQVLQGNNKRHSLVALHHQPVLIGAAWIDRYRLESPEKFFAVIDRFPQVRCISWGHVHQDFCVQREGCSLLGAPSSVANSLPGTERFALDPAGPACRWLELSADGSVETGILYSA